MKTQEIALLAMAGLILLSIFGPSLYKKYFKGCPNCGARKSINLVDEDATVIGKECKRCGNQNLF